MVNSFPEAELSIRKSYWTLLIKSENILHQKNISEKLLDFKITV